MMEKIKYEKPVVLELAAMARGMGGPCSTNGTGADGDCIVVGNGALNQCGNGNTANACTVGFSATNGCGAGDNGAG